MAIMSPLSLLRGSQPSEMAGWPSVRGALLVLSVHKSRRGLDSMATFSTHFLLLLLLLLLLIIIARWPTIVRPSNGPKDRELAPCLKSLGTSDIENSFDGVVNELEPDILRSEVEWALRSIANNKAAGDDGIPAELFKILEGDAVKVMHTICQQIWKTQDWPSDWKKSMYIPISKKGNAKECSNFRTVALISHASIVMLKIQQYMEQELPNVQAGFRKGRGTRDQIANICWIMKEAREFQKNIYFCFIDYFKAFDCVDHNKPWHVLGGMGIPSHLVCLLRNLYKDQVATVRTDHGTTDWFKIGKGVWQGCVLSPSLFNLYAEHIMRHAGLEESKAGVKIAGRNINNLRYADDTTLMAKSVEELRSLITKVKEESAKAGLQLNKWTKIMAITP
uniref:Reverse transcriptase domain-containing protein n=1 Tax=Anolis carolinensis TaxID=28377 RepID=A0A803SKV5_ANOCA